MMEPGDTQSEKVTGNVMQSLGAELFGGNPSASRRHSALPSMQDKSKSPMLQRSTTSVLKGQKEEEESK